MAPPAATETSNGSSNGHTVPMVTPDGIAPAPATHEPGLKTDESITKQMNFPSPPKFDDPYKEREYQKGRLALAFRLFAKFGFDEGVAGHITLRVGYRGVTLKTEDHAHT
jgi:hypothetical protein